MSTALISPTILRWARLRCRLDIEELAQKLPVKSEKLILWEEGAAKPTFKQAQKMAQILHIPFGYFFLPQPPEVKLPVPDLRTVNDEHRYTFSVDLQEVINDVLHKLDWYRDYLLDEEAEPLSFINKFPLSTDSAVIAEDVTGTLGLSIEDRTEARNGEEFLKLLMERSENVGIWVMRNGKVGNNTHRILDVEEFRGFVICDSYAPVVFLNGADAKAAQIFTLVHELTHLWLGESGVSDISVNSKSNLIKNSIEKKCNEVAAEVLVPQVLLLEKWKNSKSVEENAELLCNFFRVSSVVVARRALDIGLINSAQFFSYYQIQVDKWRLQKEKQESGGSFYRALPIANGRQFTEAVLQSVFSQRTLMREGARLLGVKPSNIDRFAQEVGLL